MSNNEKETLTGGDVDAWVMTDDDSFQLRRKRYDGIYELYEIERAKPIDEDDLACFKVAHAIVFISEIDIDSVLACYGYESLSELKETYGDDYEGILAECDFELTASAGECLINSPYLTWEDAKKLICELSDYREPGGDKLIEFLKKAKTYDVGHFSFFYNMEENSVLMIDTATGKNHKFNSKEDLGNIIDEQDLQLRICDGCGAPMVEGWTDNEGTTYFCTEQEFSKDMDERYGVGNWRREPSGACDWAYEYRNDANAPWLPEPSYFTEWEN